MEFDVITLIIFLWCWCLIGILNCAFIQHCYVTSGNVECAQKPITRDGLKYLGVFLGPIMSCLLVIVLLVGIVEPGYKETRKLIGLQFEGLKLF